MGYKLAGFDVIGCNEIDPKMMATYVANHNPKYSFLEPIQTFKLREDLPQELFELDILDGSPPCSSFSMAGNREKDWGKEKKFREGQAEQVLDTLFFDFIDLAKRLQPKVVIAENVKGLLLGDAQKYVNDILTAFDLAGYYVSYKLLDASKMGVPQRRERVFFYAIRKDLYRDEFMDLFQSEPKLDLDYNEPEILFSEVYQEQDAGAYAIAPCYLEYLSKCQPGECANKYHPKRHYSAVYRVDLNAPLNTIVAGNQKSMGGGYIAESNRSLSYQELKLCGSFPLDYNFKSNKLGYLIGMSVPPVMTAQIATRIYDQWLKIQNTLKESEKRNV